MFLKFFCLFSALMDIIICISSPNYFFNSNRSSKRMQSFTTTGHVSTRHLSLHLQNLLNKPHESVHGSSAYHPFSHSNALLNKMSPFLSSSPLLTNMFLNEKLLQQLKNQDLLVENTSLHRERRGIVIVDEDFDVPSELGVKQGGGNGIFDKNSRRSEEKDIEMMATEEGSGEPEDFSTGTLHNTTLEQVEISTDEIKPTPTKEYDKVISTLEYTNNATSTSVYTHTMISTSEHADKMISTSEHAEKETSPMEYTDKLPSTTDEDIEGSGDISVPYTQISQTTEEPKEQDEKSTLTVCLKRTCKSGDLTLSPGINRKVPEGTNLTLSCSSANVSESGILKLYKYNNSDSSLLEESNKERLTFQIPLSQRHHSGTYMCLKFTYESCCHQQLDITVYEVPNYRYHLIIVAIVAAISLFTCILLGIIRRFKTKNYEVQMELQNMEKPVLF